MRLRDKESVPCWKSDELDSPIPPIIEPAYFDERLDAWVLSRHDDVLTALRSRSLVMHSSQAMTTNDRRALKKMREDTIKALSHAQLCTWADGMGPLVDEQLASLSENVEVELIGAYLQPLCLELAAMVTEIDRKDAIRLRELAKPVSASAAEPADSALRESARTITPELQACFHSKTESLRDSGFVALSHTLPSLLANGCYALLQHPKQWETLHKRPGLIDAAIEELMRYGGLSRYLRRRATQDMALAGVAIRKNDQLILRIIAANRDPERFTDPNELDVLRRERGHLTMGAGPHACVGASLLRAASVAILRPLLTRFATATPGGSVEWHGGSGFRAPAQLPVILRTNGGLQETANE